jgi:cytochrome c556
MAGLFAKKARTRCISCGAELSGQKPFPQTAAEELNAQAEPSGLKAEYKRTCQICGNVWHSSVERENSLSTEKTKTSLKSMAEHILELNAWLKGHEPYDGEKIEKEQELSRLKQCPECFSDSYD